MHIVLHCILEHCDFKCVQFVVKNIQIDEVPWFDTDAIFGLGAED